MFYKAIINRFERQLVELQTKNQVYLDQANIGIAICTKTLLALQSNVEKHCFKNGQSEIDFFKTIKVLPMSYLIYFTEVRSCELRLPKIGKVEQQRFLETLIDKVNRFFFKNADFALYMEQGHTHFDKHYFTRKHVNDGLSIKSYPYYKEPSFNTSHDGIWARIKGLTLFIEYLNTKEKLLSSDERPMNHKIKWTGTYAAFVELVYGCQLMGYINNGNSSTQELMDALGDFLNIPKGNHPRTYNELKERKGSRTKFFDEAAQRLRQKMDDEDGLK